MPKERCLSPLSFGVYPHQRNLPSALCCFRIMYLRTGVFWLAYGEMVWITSQLSYWAAQAVTNGFSQIVVLIGFLFTFSQIVFVLFLIKGVKSFRLSFIAVYLCGLAGRILLYLAFLIAITIINLMVWEEGDNAFMFFRRMVVIKVIICVFYTVLKIYVFITVLRYYLYINGTVNYYRQPVSERRIEQEPAVFFREEQSGRETYVRKGSSSCDRRCQNNTM